MLHAFAASWLKFNGKTGTDRAEVVRAFCDWSSIHTLNLYIKACQYTNGAERLAHQFGFLVWKEGGFY